MALKTKNTKEIVVKGSATRAQVNAGFVIVPAHPSRTLVVTGGYMVAKGGAVGAATSVDIADTNSSPVVAVACAAAGLSENTVLEFSAASNVSRTTMGQPMTEAKGLQIIKAGSDVTTATSIDYLVRYVVD